MLNKINQHLQTYYDNVTIEKHTKGILIRVHGTPVHTTNNELSAHSWIHHHVKSKRRTVKELIHCLQELGMIELPEKDYGEDTLNYRKVMIRELNKQGIKHDVFYNPETREYVFKAL